MNAYETYRYFEPLAGFLVVIFFLGWIFIPKGKVKKVLYHIYCGFVVLMCLAMGAAGINLLLLVFTAAFGYLTVWLYGQRRNGLSFLFLLLTVICGFLWFNMGVRLK